MSIESSGSVVTCFEPVHALLFLVVCSMSGQLDVPVQISTPRSLSSVPSDAVSYFFFDTAYCSAFLALPVMLILGDSDDGPRQASLY